MFGSRVGIAIKGSHRATVRVRADDDVAHVKNQYRVFDGRRGSMLIASIRRDDRADITHDE
jgi:hypothetical protein